MVFVLAISRVNIGSLAHVLPIVIAIIFTIYLVYYSNKYFTLKQKEKFLHALGIFVSGTVVLFHIYKICQGSYNIQTDLPFYLCSFLALTIPFFTHTRKYWLYEILYFWIVAGTLQAVITPDIPVGYPSFAYFRYWVAHLGLLVIIFYATFALGMRPRFISVFKSVLALQVYMLVTYIVNTILNANYSYLNKKPESASALDFFGDWPYYIFQIELIIIPYFLLLYLPFYFTRKKN